MGTFYLPLFMLPKFKQDFINQFRKYCPYIFSNLLEKGGALENIFWEK